MFPYPNIDVMKAFFPDRQVSHTNTASGAARKKTDPGQNRRDHDLRTISFLLITLFVRVCVQTGGAQQQVAQTIGVDTVQPTPLDVQGDLHWDRGLSPVFATCLDRKAYSNML